jgi:hypothetical protein
MQLEVFGLNTERSLPAHGFMPEIETSNGTFAAEVDLNRSVHGLLSSAVFGTKTWRTVASPKLMGWGGSRSSSFITLPRESFSVKFSDATSGKFTHFAPTFRNTRTSLFPAGALVAAATELFRL